LNTKNRIRKAIKIACFYFFVFALLISCQSNALKQELAEKVIREYITNNPLETTFGLINLQTIQQIEKTNVFTEKNTKVKVIINPERGQEFSLDFIFYRTPGNQWFLQTIKADDYTTKPVEDWLRTKKNLNIGAQ